ncbi:MAG TPA: aryl-sulfate sulfotransferase N-terminal domain-containing protein, partial [Acidimicrobiales bacterium]
MNRRRAIVAFLALALGAGAAACSDDGDPAATTEPPTTSAEVVEAPSGVLTDVSVRLSNQSTIAGVLTVAADEPVHVEVTATPSGDDPVVEVPRTARALRRHRLPVVGLRAETTYDLAVTAFDDAGDPAGQGVVQMTTGALPD